MNTMKPPGIPITIRPVHDWTDPCRNGWCPLGRERKPTLMAKSTRDSDLVTDIVTGPIPNPWARTRPIDPCMFGWCPLGLERKPSLMGPDGDLEEKMARNSGKGARAL